MLVAGKRKEPLMIWDFVSLCGHRAGLRRLQCEGAWRVMVLVMCRAHALAFGFAEPDMVVRHVWRLPLPGLQLSAQEHGRARYLCQVWTRYSALLKQPVEA